MSPVVEIRELEDCFDGSVTYEVVLAAPVEEWLMYHLARGGKLDYHPEFPRPYFRITRPRAWIAQGVIGNSTFRLTGSPSCEGDPAQHLRDQIEEGERAHGSKAEAVL